MMNEALRAKYELLSYRMARKALSAYTKQLFDKLKDVENPTGIMDICRQQIDTAGIKQLYSDMYITTGVKFANESYKLLKGAKSANYHKDMSWYYAQWMQNFVDTTLGDRIAQVTRTTYEGIQENARKAIEKGVAEGWGGLKIAREIVKLQGTMDTWRALRIARTEVVSASNMGSLSGAQSTGLNLLKEWLPMNDKRVRTDPYNHKGMKGQKVRMSEKFFIKGEAGQPDDYLTVPGDPQGQAANVINCRCTQIYEVL